MIPNKKIEELISRHSALEKDLSSGTIDKKLFAEKSKEYSQLNEIVEDAKKYISFEKDKNEIKKIAERYLELCGEILTKENVKFENKVLAELIMKYFPDFRRVLNELQRYSVSGTIDVGILSNLNEINLTELVNGLRGKKFSEVRKWVNQNMDQDTAKLYRKLYDNFSQYLKPQSVPQAILIIADYQYKSAFVADQEINMVACLTEIMVECEFK